MIEAVSAESGVHVRDLLGPYRARRISAVRFDLMARLRALDWNGRAPSYPMIGRWIGRDHSTVIHGVRRHAEIAAAAGAQTPENA